MNHEISEVLVERLLCDLCRRYGVCVSPHSLPQLMEELSSGVDGFTDAVFRAEGCDPYAGVPLRHRREVRAVIADFFKEIEDDTVA
jgi:hypothetical protein